MRRTILFFITALVQFTVCADRKNELDPKNLKMDAVAPTITSFTPASGSIGTLVTIAGTNLSTPTSFYIGGVSAILISDNGNTLVGMVMPSAVTGGISLTTSGGTATSLGNFIITPTPFPSIQQGNKLVGTNWVGMYGIVGAGLGWSVSVSADGNTAIVNSGDSSNTTAALIFIRSNGMWTQQGNKLFGTGEVGNGGSVAISADGNTAIVGGGDSSGVGAIWIFMRSGGVWTQQGGKLIGTGGIGASGQGSSVSISADGNTAIEGGPNDDNYLVGASWVFVRGGGVWSQQGGKLVGSGGVGDDGQNQGTSVSISADGNTAIVGGPYDSLATGAAWIFARSGGVWTQQGNKLVGTGGAAGTDVLLQGNSVSISADGNTAIVGGPYDSSLVGASWIFTRTRGVWSQQGSKLVGTGGVGESQQGSSVSLSADGNTAIVGAYTDSVANYRGDGTDPGIGAAWTFIRSGGVWTQKGNKLVGTGRAGYPFQGTSVSISADGSTAMVGGPQDSSDVGAAWVYIQNINITWIGAISTSWMTGGNWSGGVVPGINNTVIIPAGTPFSPVVSTGTNTSIKSIYELPGALLTIQTNARLNVTN